MGHVCRLNLMHVHVPLSIMSCVRTYATKETMITHLLTKPGFPVEKTNIQNVLKDT